MADSSIYEKLDLFYLGREIDPATGTTTTIPLLYKSKHLTTHAAILGMTGSGKTGLGIGLLEEAAIDRIPALIIDPKGDMANLLLTFPEMRPEDFKPWIDPSRAEQKGVAPAELARQTAAEWEEGLRSWDQDRGRVARLKESAEFSLFTPGSTMGTAVSVLAALDAPEPSILEDNATAAGIINATVSSLLALVGIQADPLSSREHILLASILLHQWRQGKDLTLESLIGSVVTPPFERVGVFALEDFYPQRERMHLGMQLNNIVASPSFKGWLEGEPLRIESLLYAADGRPRVSIFSIAHLSEPERMFFVTMLLGRLISWMRRQEGTGNLRCLLYMDEIFGYFPPLGNPPSKEPMLLLLKQARAYGLGIVLATQNPVDLDYKGLSNIGTWFIGRLQTRQDQKRVLTGISGTGFAHGNIEQLLANMRGRTFLMQSAHLDQPVLFETRWVLSYLKGPISLSEISRLTGNRDDPGGRESKQRADTAVFAAGNGFSADPALLPKGIMQYFAPLSVPAQNVKYIPWLAAAATVRFVDSRRGIDQGETVNVRLELDKNLTAVDWQEAIANPVPFGALTEFPPEDASFRNLPPVLTGMRTLGEPEKLFTDFLYHTRKLKLKRVKALGLESRPDESDSQFQQRLVDCLQDGKSAEIEKLERDYHDRQEKLNSRLDKLYGRLEKEKGDVWARGVDAALSFGVALFGAIAGRKALSVSTATRSARGVRNAGRVVKERGDVRMVEEEVKELEEKLSSLAQELQEKIVDITDRFAPENYPLEEFFITPRRSDIYDVKTFLQWEPLQEFSA